MNDLVKGLLWGLVAQIFTFFQLQGQFVFEFNRKYPWIIILSGIPLSYMFIKSVKYLVTYFNGEIWPSRLIGFGIGVIVFTLLSQILFKESLTLKTSICLFLGIAIVCIQVFWK